MEGRQIVALKMRVRFSSITPASNRRARSRVSLFAESETAHSALRTIKIYTRSHKPNR